jgi:hypothetical protein
MSTELQNFQKRLRTEFKRAFRDLAHRDPLRLYTILFDLPQQLQKELFCQQTSLLQGDKNIRRKIWCYKQRIKTTVIAHANKHPGYLKRIKAFLTQEQNLYRHECYEIFARIGGEEMLALNLELASACFTEQGNRSPVQAIDALQHYLDDPKAHKTLARFVKTSVAELRKSYRKRHQPRPENFSRLCQLAAKLDHPELRPVLHEMFRYTTDAEQDQEMIQLAGKVALAMAMTNDNDERTIILLQNFLNDYEWYYPGETWIMEVHYALWYLTEDSDGAQAYITNSDNKFGKSYAAAAIADLNITDAAPILADRLGMIANPVTEEAFIEAINRLEVQTSKRIQQKMIWMFYEMTDRWGNVYGNQFVQRACCTRGERGLEMVSLADEFEDIADTTMDDTLNIPGKNELMEITDIIDETAIENEFKRLTADAIASIEDLDEAGEIEEIDVLENNKPITCLE